MQLTGEQRNIIETARKMRENEILKIEACAGSGKTATLAEIALAEPDRRFLYLAFNKTCVEEAKNRFPSNVTIMTTHSLAYQWFCKSRDRKYVAVRNGYRVFDIRSLFKGTDNAFLSVILTGFKNFCQSSLDRPLSKDVAYLYDQICKGRLPPDHDFYLKEYQLSAEERFKGYDYVLLDEAQDTNDVTLAIFLEKNSCRRILVGDSHQSIYGFRGAVNALSKVRADHSLVLSCSFRTIQPILNQANFFIQTFHRQHPFTPMRSGQTSGKSSCSSLAVISRTNAGIIREIAEKSSAELKKCTLLRSAHQLFDCPLSILYLRMRRRDKIRPACAWMKGFKSFRELLAYAGECTDLEILHSLSLIQQYDTEIFGLYETALKLEKQHSASCVFTTAHSAKGLEWDSVRLTDDFCDLNEEYHKMQDTENRKSESRNIMQPEEFGQELNLYYVALTRARFHLEDNTANAFYYHQNRTRA